MEPWFAGMLLAVLMCFTCTCYFFRIPDDLRHQGVPGYWGRPNAEFNWCEHDYEDVDWIAEPMNTVSNVVYAVLPAAFLRRHKGPSWETVTLACIEMMIGAGSVLFHATLRYRMQLVDEIPILWLGLLLAAGCCRRLGHPDRRGLAAASALALSAWILGTEQHSGVHEAARGVMTVGFSMCVIVIAWGMTRITKRLDKEFRHKLDKIAAYAVRVHALGFTLFVLAVICWLADNYFCPKLQNLPYGLPYPHLHVWWHVLTAGALYFVKVTLYVDEQRLALAAWNYNGQAPANIEQVAKYMETMEKSARKTK